MLKNVLYYIQFYLGKLFLYGTEKIISFFIEDKIFFNKSQFNWVYELEKNYLEILEEYNKVFEENKVIDVTKFSQEQRKSIDPNFWSIFPIKTFGINIIKNQLRCPKTTSMINKIPDCTTVWFSVMKPGTNVLPHRGIFKGYLRCLLCIKAPNNISMTGIIINEQLYNFETSKAVIFDDTYTHSAFNKSDEDRVVLYIDFIRPMPYLLRKFTLLINYIISQSSYVKNFNY